MKLQTQATNMSLTPEIIAYLEKRLTALDKFVEGHEEAIMDVELGKTTNHHRTGDVFKAEFTLSIKKATLRAVAETPDLYASIDMAKDEMERDLRRYKTKRRDLVRRGALAFKNFLRGFRKR